MYILWHSVTHIHLLSMHTIYLPHIHVYSVHTCSYSCAHAYLHTKTRIYIREPAQKYRNHTHIHTHTYTHTHTDSQTHTHTLLRIYWYAHTHTTHTHKYTIIRRLLTSVHAQTTPTYMRMHIFLKQAQHTYHTYIDHLYHHISVYVICCHIIF